MTGTIHESNYRALGNTEQNWCRVVASGTGITVLALQMSKPPPEIAATLARIITNLQKRHPLLTTKLHYNAATKTLSFLKTTAAPPHEIKTHDVPNRHPLSAAISPLQAILEHELNLNSWSDPKSFPCSGVETFHSTVYAAAAGNKSIVVLRFHTAVCDRTTAVSVLRELMEMMGENGTHEGLKNEDEGKNGIESLIPSGTARKTLWSHGIDMLGYSVNSFKLTNLTFDNTKLPRRSEFVRLQMSRKYTSLILQGCKTRGIKLCGALAAAAILAAHSAKFHVSHQKYGVVTLTDCRSILQQPLSHHHYGFYHSAILNVHKVKGGENMWDLAKACYVDFAAYKKANKHFSDMADLNFLMSKAVDNPSLTAAASLRTSLVSVFEDPVIDDDDRRQREIGVEDYMGCASVHGVGPSIAVFDTVRGGELDCVCVYPAPLHSREKMKELVDRMVRVMIDGV